MSSESVRTAQPSPAMGLDLMMLLDKGMAVAFFQVRDGIADLVNGFDAGAGLCQAESFSSQNAVIAQGVQIRETAAEFNLFAVNGDGAVGSLAGCLDTLGQRGFIHTEKPPDSGFLQFDIPGGFVMFQQVDHIFLNITEDPDEHVIKVDTDIGGNAAGFFRVSFPGGKIPVSSGGDIGEIDLIFSVQVLLFHLFFQRDQGRMQPQLQDVVHPDI